MSFPTTIVGVIIGLFAFAKCQQPLDDVTDLSPVPSAPEDIQNCSHLRQENERLRLEVESLTSKLEVIREMEEEESEESNESNVTSRGHRERRGVKCDAGTLAAWACAPQCVFKLKGLCGLSLKVIYNPQRDDEVVRNLSNKRMQTIYKVSYKHPGAKKGKASDQFSDEFMNHFNRAFEEKTQAVLRPPETSRRILGYSRFNTYYTGRTTYEEEISREAYKAFKKDFDKGISRLFRNRSKEESD